MTVTSKLFNILSGHGYALIATVTMTFDLVTSKLVVVIY